MTKIKTLRQALDADCLLYTVTVQPRRSLGGLIETSFLDEKSAFKAFQKACDPLENSEAWCDSPIGNKKYWRRTVALVAILVVLLFGVQAQAQGYGRDTEGRPHYMLVQQETPKRVALLKSNYSMAQVIKFVDKCGDLTLIGDTEKADYLLVIEEEPNRGKHTALTLLNQQGDVLFSTRTLKLSNAFKDMCDFLSRMPNGGRS